MLTILKRSTFSTDYRLFDGPDHVADLTLSRWRDAGKFTVDGLHYILRRPRWSWTGDPLMLESDGSGERSSPGLVGSRRLVAYAKSSTFFRSNRPLATMTYGHWECELWQGRTVRLPGTWFLSANEIDLRAGGVLLGSWTIDLGFRRTTAAPCDVPLEIKVFIAAWMLLVKRLDGVA
jgi:hypothetical protein